MKSDIRNIDLGKNEIIFLSIFAVLMFLPQIIYVFSKNLFIEKFTDSPGWFIYLVVLFGVAKVVSNIIEKKTKGPKA